MQIKFNEHDKNYPYTIMGGWGDEVYCDKEDLKELRAEIDKILGKKA
jgi:hypothetical protein